MSWPKYYDKEIIYNNNEQADIAIVSGWTKKEIVYDKLSDKNKQRVIAIGQLYSKEGINFIIRNCFLNPKIRRIIVTGQDLSGSVKIFKNFLKGNNYQDIVHKEIAIENVKQFIDYYKLNHNVVDLNSLNDLIDALDISENSTWIDEALEFSERVQKESLDYPSEEVVYRLEDDKIANLWPQILDKIIKFGVTKHSSYGEMQRELINIISVINDEDPDDPYLPEYLYFNKQELNDYYPQIMTDRIFDGVEYTYGSRMRNFNGINQIEFIINKLKKQNYKRSALAVLRDVNIDGQQKPSSGGKSPCLTSVQALVQNQKVYLTVYIRSNDMYRAWPQNAFGLRNVQKEIAKGLDLGIGKLTIISSSAHIYERDFVSACEIVDRHINTGKFRQDMRGSFEIKIEDGLIKVLHYSTQGNLLQEFEAINNKIMMKQLSAFVSDIGHALDLGAELQKAQIALDQKIDYVQDNELSF